MKSERISPFWVGGYHPFSAVENAPQPKNVSKVTVQMEFENGIRFCREGMEVESLIEFLTKIKPVLCLS